MSTLKVNKIIPTAGVPTGGGGGIIQIKQTVKTSRFSTTTTGNTIDVTGVNVSITPTSSTSKIFVICSGYYGNGNSDSFGHLRLARTISGGSEDMHLIRGDASSNSTRATMSATLRNGGGESSNVARHFGCHYLDSPSTTNSIEYKLMILVTQGTPAVIGGSSGNNDSNRGSYPTFITAMEVSA